MRKNTKTVSSAWKSVKDYVLNRIALFIVLGVAALCAVFLICGTKSDNGSITIDGKDAKIEQSTEDFISEAKDAMITYAKEAVPTIITNADGKEETIDAPTVLEIDAQNPICPEGQECGIGKYIYAPTGTATEFKNYTIGKCWNTDGYYGSQCWDLGDLFWQNYAGRNLNTCGTGAAKGTWNCRSKNAGKEFDLITDPKQLRLGDWVVFNNGTWGHIGMAMGNYNNGYIALLGQNQGGSACAGGGSSANIINISLGSFAGAFRPKTYVKPTPAPEPTPTPTPSPSPEPVSYDCNTINVVKGDTMGSIMKRCKGYVVYGQAMNEYASHWYSTKIKPGQSVYQGWLSPTGYGLFANDTIIWK